MGVVAADGDAAFEGPARIDESRSHAGNSRIPGESSSGVWGHISAWTAGALCSPSGPLAMSQRCKLRRPSVTLVRARQPASRSNFEVSDT